MQQRGRRVAKEKRKEGIQDLKGELDVEIVECDGMILFRLRREVGVRYISTSTLQPHRND